MASAKTAAQINPAANSSFNAAIIAPATSFLQFLKAKSQMQDLILLGIAYLLLYALTYYCYPFPMSTEDSPSYINSAITDTYSGYRPMGYSWFLQFFHSLNSSFAFISFAQFWIHAFVTAFFLLTIKYFYPPKNKLLFYGLAAFTILSPMVLYLTHWVMSDSIFASFTLLWLTTGIWLLHRLNWLVAIIHLVAMFFAIQVRFAGLFYPIFTCLALFYVYRFQVKTLAIAAASLFLVFIIQHNVKKTTRELFGINTFSGFSGWAQANNAVAIIPYIDLKPEELNDYELGLAHSIITQFPDSAYSPIRILGTSFIWKKEFAGKYILGQVMQNRYMGNYTSAWIYTGDMLGRYANYLIKHYPLQYFQHFILLNAKQIFYPFVTLSPYKEFPVADFYRQWYGLNDLDKFRARFDLVGTHLAPVLRPACLVLWVLMAAVGIYGFVRRKAILFTKEQKLIFWFLLVFMVAYLGFSVIAHPIHLRYLLPVHALQTAFMYLILNGIRRKAVETPNLN